MKYGIGFRAIKEIKTILEVMALVYFKIFVYSHFIKANHVLAVIGIAPARNAPADMVINRIVAWNYCVSVEFVVRKLVVYANTSHNDR